jgi:hypothetical protein
MQTETVARGDKQTLEAVVPVRDILGASLTPGTYYFAVVVSAEGMQMTMSAGELDLK